MQLKQQYYNRKKIKMFLCDIDCFLEIKRIFSNYSFESI